MKLKTFVKKFRSIEIAAQDLLIPERTLRRWLKGESKPTGAHTLMFLKSKGIKP